jgi:hypothetical protein
MPWTEPPQTQRATLHSRSVAPQRPGWMAEYDMRQIGGSIVAALISILTPILFS